MGVGMVLMAGGILSTLSAQETPPLCYVPVEGGWRIAIPAEAASAPGIGVAEDNARLHFGPACRWMPCASRP
ncbi:MAG TPA: hypothetical protein PLO37_22775 [Candidatus Hydrogenedentes bacterium]|nr:hypothetical protein [Candidatus Hydrogenedentota bacterium]